jgi:polyisoprenoid-binding protein YceI
MTSLLASAPAVADYYLDPAGTRLGFVARHALVTRVRGRFDELWGQAHLDLERISHSWVKVDIQAASVTTRNSRRDDHLRSKDFLDVFTHPVISFRSLRVSRLTDTTFKVVGDLTIRGVTKTLPLVFEYAGCGTDEHGRLRLAFHAATVISRRSWGITWNESLDKGGAVVGDRVALELDVAVVRATDAEQGSVSRPRARAGAGSATGAARAAGPGAGRPVAPATTAGSGAAPRPTPALADGGGPSAA